MKNPKLRISLLLILLALSLISGVGCSAQPKDSHVGAEAANGFSFIFMSDSQANPETGDYTAWGQLLRSASENKSRPAFIMIGGDLINDGSDQAEWDAFFAAGGDVLKKMTL